MKKVITIILALVFVFTLSACGNKDTASDTNISAPTSSEAFVKPENYATVLLVSINSQFKLYLDESNKVLAVEPVNDDAKSFCDNIGFENKSVEAVVGNIVEKANEKGFIKENAVVNFEITEQKDGVDSSNILTTVVSAANQKATELKIEIKTEIKESDNSQTTETNSDNKQTGESSKTETSSKNEGNTSKPTTTTKPTETKPTESESNESKPTHTHSYSDATCTAPQKCSCGETKGSALGHKWQDATCEVPKICSVCKITEGNKAEHVLEGTTCKWCKQVVVVSPTLLKNRNYEFYKLIDYPFEEEGLSGTIALYTASVDFSGNREPIYFDGMYHEGELNPNYPAEAPQPIFYKNKYYFPNTNLGPFDSQKSISGNRIVLTFTEHNAQMKIEFELLSNDTLKVVSMKNISQTDPCKFNFSVGDIFE